MMKLLIVAAVCLLTVQCVRSTGLTFKPTELPCYRLPLNVKPTAYNLHLRFPSIDSDVYEGNVNISVEFLTNDVAKLQNQGTNEKNNGLAELAKSEEVDCSLSGENNQIVLHADESLDIQDIKVKTEHHLAFLFIKRQKKRKIVELGRDRGKQMIAIKLKNNVSSKAKGTISISFKGKMRKDKRGVYVSTYNEGQQEYKHIVSQFQPTDARTVFPCFDEPRFKVPFSLKLSHEAQFTSYANTELVSSNKDEGTSLVVKTFETTPNMPVHMVAFVIGPFDTPIQDELVRTLNNGKIAVQKVRVLTVPGKRETGRFALKVARDSLEWFEKYIEYDFPLKKLDVIAIADHDKDNTESWGLVFVRDNLLWIDDETKPDTRITTAVNVAHVVVHQWFANLITAGWWSDLWITEGVAAQFAFRFVQERLASFQSEYFVRIATLSGVMQSDQPGNLHPLSPPQEVFKTTDQIYEIFDNLEFMKSASMAQQINDVVGDDWYRKFLKRLVRNYAYKSVTKADYIQELSIDGVGATSDKAIIIVRTWPGYQGVPLVNIKMQQDSWFDLEANIENFATAQKSIENYMTTSKNYPLGLYATMRVAEGCSITRQLYGILLVSSSSKLISTHLTLPSWFQLSQSANNYVKISPTPNIGTYYRTRYTDELLELLQLVVEKKQISDMNRLQLLDDYNQLVSSQLVTNDTFKSLLNSYTNEDSPAVIIEMLAATKTLAGLKTTDDKPSTSSKAFLNLYEKFGFRVNGKESFTDQRARQLTYKFLITRGNQQVISEALKTFDDSNGNVALFLREPVYTAVVLAGSEEQVNQLIEKLSITKSFEERVRLATALSLSTNTQTLAKTKSWLESSGLKPEIKKPILDAIEAKL